MNPVTSEDRIRSSLTSENLKPARHKDETQEQYKLRRAAMKHITHVFLGGEVVWQSSELGTYRKPKAVDKP